MQRPKPINNDIYRVSNEKFQQNFNSGHKIIGYLFLDVFSKSKKSVRLTQKAQGVTHNFADQIRTLSDLGVHNLFAH